MTKKKLSKKETAQKSPARKEETAKPQVKKEEIQKQVERKESLIQKIIGRPRVKEEKAAEPKPTGEEEIIEKSFAIEAEAREEASAKKEELAKKIVGEKAGEEAGKTPEPKFSEEEEIIERGFVKGEEEKAPVKKEEAARKQGLLDKILGRKVPVKTEEKLEKVEQKIIPEKEVKPEQKVAEEVKAPEPKVMIEEKAAPEPVEHVSEAELRDRCLEFNKLLGDFTHSVGVELKEVERLRKSSYGSDTAALEKEEKELYAKFESSRNEVKAELDELHRVLGKHEERVKYKDEAEGELGSLEEVKVMLGEKLRNISRRIERLRVRQRSDLANLSAEAKECEEEVRRSEADILDFEREYTKFLSMMGKISG